MGSFRWPQAVSSREVGEPVPAWTSPRKHVTFIKIRKTPKNFHRSANRRRRIANVRYRYKGMGGGPR